MSPKIMLGKPVADAVKENARALVLQASQAGHAVTLATLRVGERPEDVAYERSITKAASALGIAVDAHVFDEGVEEGVVLDAMLRLNEDDAVDGVMMFRPLPGHLDEAVLCNAISPSKDVDGVSAQSLAGVLMGEGAGFAPATAEACIETLDFYEVPLDGRHVVVVGRSLVIGKPVGMMLLSRDATVTYCHSRTQGLASIMRSADIVVCAVGRARFFDAAYCREGQVVLDVGINDDGEGGLCGDVDYESVGHLVDAITPVPRGIGSVSTSVLLRHVAQAACRKHALI